MWIGFGRYEVRRLIVACILRMTLPTIPLCRSQSRRGLFRRVIVSLNNNVSFLQSFRLFYLWLGIFLIILEHRSFHSEDILSLIRNRAVAESESLLSFAVFPFKVFDKPVIQIPHFFRFLLGVNNIYEPNILIGKVWPQLSKNHLLVLNLLPFRSIWDNVDVDSIRIIGSNLLTRKPMLNLHPQIGLPDSFGQLAYLNLPEHSLLLLIRHPMHLRFIHILLRHLPLRAVSYIKLLLHLPPSIQLLQSI